MKGCAARGREIAAASLARPSIVQYEAHRDLVAGAGPSHLDVGLRDVWVLAAQGQNIGRAAHSGSVGIQSASQRAQRCGVAGKCLFRLQPASVDHYDERHAQPVTPFPPKARGLAFFERARCATDAGRYTQVIRWPAWPCVAHVEQHPRGQQGGRRQRQADQHSACHPRCSPARHRIFRLGHPHAPWQVQKKGQRPLRATGLNGSCRLPLRSETFVRQGTDHLATTRTISRHLFE